MNDKDFIEEYKNKREIELKIKNQIKHDKEYMAWLEEFTMIHHAFCDDDWLYNSDEISKNDHEKVKNIYLLFEIIDNYANQNYIYPTECELGNFYSIKYNDIVYDVGVVYGQGVTFFCNRTTQKRNFIEFNHIQTNMEQPGIEFIKYNLQSLETFIEKMVEDNIPIEAIRNTTNKVLKKTLEK